MNYWRLELVKLFLLLGAALAAGFFFGEVLFFLILALVVNIAMHLYQINRLEAWLTKYKTEKSLPIEGLGKFWSSLTEPILQEDKKFRSSPVIMREKAKSPLLVKRKGFAHAEIGTLMINESDDVVWCNKEIEELLGFSYAETCSKNIGVIIKDDRFFEYLQSKKYYRPLRSNALHDDKRVFEYQVIVFGEEERLVIIRDITQLDRLESMRKDFVGNLSHELRTPITVIQGYSEAMLDNVGDVDKKWKKPLKQMHQSAIRMKNLIKDLLLLSSLETETPTGQRDNVNLESLLSEITGDTQQVFSKKKHEYIIECEPDIYITGDRSELYSAFSNLLSNAAKYTLKRGSIQIRALTSENYLDIEIIDNGIGIDNKHIPRLTERFYRVSESRTTDTGGTGLGLAIVKHILARHDGELEIHSLIGLGSRFVCRLSQSRITKVHRSSGQDFKELHTDAKSAERSASL